jgi:YHS domain-containing protein
LPEVPLDPQAMLPPPAFEPRPAEAFPQEMPVEPLESAYAPPPAVAANRPSALEDTPPLETPLETPLQSPQPSPLALQPTVQPAARAPATPLASDVPPGENGSLWRLKRALANARSAATHEAPPSEGWAEASQQGVAWNEPYAPPAVTTPLAPELEAPPMNLPAVEAAPAIAVRAVDHQSPVEVQFRTAQQQVYQQPVEQPVQPPDVTVQGVWQAEAAPMLEGYCPVSLVKNEQWVKGEPRWSVVHEGRTYYMADEIQRECFLVNPERYVPALGGFDPVTFVDEGRNVPGVLDYCVTYDGRLYMFSSSTALARFRQDSRRYLSNLH